MNDTNNKKKNRRSLLKSARAFIRHAMKPENEFITSAEAYNITTYGCYDSIDKIIERERQRINMSIRERMVPACFGASRFDSYNTIVSFVDDMKPYIEEILKPFRERGFRVTLISDRVEELAEDNVYLISWYKPGEKEKSNI